MFLPPAGYGALTRVAERFSNGVAVISLYLNPLPTAKAPPIESSIFQVMKEVSLLYCLPDNPFFSTAGPSSHAVQDAAYACQSRPFLLLLSLRMLISHRLVGSSRSTSAIALA